MKKIDTAFIELLKKKIPNNISATEEIACTLGINYDAAYRRLNNKVSFNLNEIVLLAKKFDISLNRLFEVGDKLSYLVKSTYSIQNINDFKTYLKSLTTEMLPLTGKKDSSITFSARELPMFYFFEQPILIRFKIFIWFNILKVTPVNKRISFTNFVISEEMIGLAKEARETYNQINQVEMWSFGTLNNVLQQLLYLFRMRQLSLTEATEICDALTIEIKNVEAKTQTKNNSTLNSFTLYFNELFMMNNSIILKNKDKLRFAYPYALLKYFQIDNQEACREQEAYIIEQMRHAINLSNTSTKEHASFFNYKYDKIKQVLLVMQNEDEKPVFL